MYNSIINNLLNDLDEFHFSTDSVKSQGDVYLAKLVIPGIKKKDLKISSTNDFLKIYLKKEKKDDSLLKKINLGGLVDIGKITSKLEDGILEITLPKKEVSESVDIKIM